MKILFILSFAYRFNAYVIEKEFEYKSMKECTKRAKVLETNMAKEGYPLIYTKCSKKEVKK